MKKIAGIVLLCMMGFTLAACGQTQESTASSEAGSSAAAETVSRQETVEETVAETAAEAAAAETGASESGAEETGSGNTRSRVSPISPGPATRKRCGMIQEEVGGDLFEIAPAEPYTEDYDTLLEIAQTEQQEEARPELAARVENWDSYDVVFVGFPNWWSDAPDGGVHLPGKL